MKLPSWLPYAGIAAFYVTLVVIARIWMAPIYTGRFQSEGAAMTMHWSAINERVIYENELLRRMTLEDSLSKVLPRATGLYIDGLADSVDVVVNRRGSESSVQKASLRDLASREMGGTPKASIHLVGVPIRYGTHPDIREGVWRRMVFAGVIDGHPYCAVAIGRSNRASLQRHESILLTRDGTLGVCVFWSRYGAPGPQIQKWLDDGGVHFAGSANVSGSSDVLQHAPPELLARQRRRYMLPLAGQACLAGRKDVCAQAIINPRVRYGEPDSASRLSDWDARIAPNERAMFTRLERDFGSQKFEQFWTSNEPFAPAFQKAFAVDVGTWIQSWLEPVGRIDRGARIAGSSVLLTLLFLGICCGVALATAQHRRV
jgi:hypothetical protein